MLPTSMRREWIAPFLLIVLSVVPAVAGTLRLAELSGGGPITEGNARFFSAPVPVMLHILSVIPFSVLGALQFVPSLRRRRHRWHQVAGLLLVPCGLAAAVTGLWMAHFYPWPTGDGEILYWLRLLFGSAMVLAIVLAMDAIRRRDFRAHGRWMTRGYAIGMGAGTQVLTHLPWFILIGQPGEHVRAVLMGAGWIINLGVAEWVVRRRD